MQVGGKVSYTARRDTPCLACLAAGRPSFRIKSSSCFVLLMPLTRRALSGLGL